MNFAIPEQSKAAASGLTGLNHTVQLDTLVIVDAIAANLMVDGGTVISLHPQEGFAELAILINNGKLCVTGFKFIVLLCGRSDLWAAEADF